MALPPIKPFPSSCSGTIKPHTIGTGGAGGGIIIITERLRAGQAGPRGASGWRAGAAGPPEWDQGGPRGWRRGLPLVFILGAPELLRGGGGG